MNYVKTGPPLIPNYTGTRYDNFENSALFGPVGLIWFFINRQDSCPLLAKITWLVLTVYPWTDIYLICAANYSETASKIGN